MKKKGANAAAVRESKTRKRKTAAPKMNGLHFHSLKTKLVVLVVSSILISIVSLLGLMLNTVQSSMLSLVYNYMGDVCGAIGSNIDAAYNQSGPIVLNKNYLARFVSGAGLSDMESSYAYVVSTDPEGTMIFHPNSELEKKPCDNNTVQDVLAQVRAGEVEPDGLISYEYDGVSKYGAYHIISNNSAVLVVTANKSELLSDINRMIRISVLLAVIIIVIFCIIAYIISAKMTRPLLDITKVINRFSTLDLTESATATRLSRRKDETGQIANALNTLRESLSEITSQIKLQCTKLYDASNVLDANATRTNTTVNNVESAVNEIATGATNQAAETQKATDNIIDMGNMIEHTTSEVEGLTSTSNLMKQSSDEATATLKELDEINKHAIESIDIIYQQTNTTNSSAMKIKEATSLIASIADETNLLSLNASIEAARAGEAGRGFAVVASQIQKLAEQSNDSTRQIDDIIRILLEDSQKAVATMDEVKSIMQQQSDKVAKTGTVFSQVREGIADSLTGVNEISDKTAHLDIARSSVIDVVQSLTAIAEQNAASTQETSASVIEVSNIMNEISSNAKELKEIALILEQNMEKFQL